MALKNLTTDLSLDSLWAEMAYTGARLRGDPNAVDLAPTVDPLITELENTRAGQWRSWMGEIEAQAQCDYLNGQLDDLVVEIADTLLFTVKDRRSPRMTRYFRQTPYSIVRLALKSELDVVRSWREPLKTEPEAPLSALGTRLADLVAKADAALEAQHTAENARIDFRVRTINPLIDRLNDARLKLFGQLVSRAEEKHLGKGWPEGFFKVTSRRTAARSDTPVVADPG